MKLLSSVLVLLSFSYAAGAAAQCPKRMPTLTPSLIDGESATMAGMQAMQEDVENFVAAGEAYLDCVDLHPVVHNQRIGELREIAQSYNDELAAFLKNRNIVAGR